MSLSRPIQYPNLTQVSLKLLLRKNSGELAMAMVLQYIQHYPAFTFKVSEIYVYLQYTITQRVVPGPPISSPFWNLAVEE